MVDAIGAAGSKPITKVSELKANWGRMTASEIIEHEKDGLEVPKEILKWAEDMVKISGAVDDITYDAANGEVTSPEEVAKPEDETTAIDGTPVELNEAQAARQQMNNDGLSLPNQAKALTGMSKDIQSQNAEMIQQMEQIIQKADAASAQASTITDETISGSASIKSEYDKLMDRLNSDTKEPLTKEEEARLVTLGQQLGKIGNQGQNALNGITIDLQSVDSALSESGLLAQNAYDFGSETINTGLELIGQKPGETNQDATKSTAKHKGGNPFDPTFSIAIKAINQGGKTIEAGAENEQKTAQAGEVKDTAIQKTEIDKVKIQNATYVEAKSSSDGKEKPEEITTDEKEENEFALADEEITADVTEIIKRKERKGIV